MIDKAAATIMIVDDTPLNLKLLGGMLKEQGYETRALTRGALVLQAVLNDPPDLILLDINMPEMDGYAVCRQLKNTPEVKDIPVIFISTLNAVRDKTEAFTCGGVDYVTKPFQFEEVLARVDTHLQIRNMQIQLKRHNDSLETLVQEQVQDIVRAKEELSLAQHATILSMSKIAEARDDDTGRHIERTQIYCRALAVELQRRERFKAVITDRFIQNIYNAAPLHDIGKVAIPDSILQKPQKLTVDEFNVMKTHTISGAKTLQTVLVSYPNNTFIAMGVSIAQSHHERWDGSGYPDGLKGDAIPLPAQIMAVADVYDALSSDRCYRPALTHEETRDYILANIGGQFSPVVGEAFKAIEAEFIQIKNRLND